MSVINFNRLLLGVVITVGLSNLSFAQNSEFRQVQLLHGISLDVPSHWIVLSQASRKNLGAAAQALMDNSEIEGANGQKERLLAMNSVPEPTGAMIRVSVTSPPDFTQADLEATTLSDLKELGPEFLSMFRKVEASGGPKIIEMHPLRIDKLNNHLVFIISYIRAGVNGPSPWQVTQYKIPVSNKLIEITLSHRKLDAIVWKPILERVKRSVIF